MPNEDANPRTIDQRLDGVTQTLEIIAAMQRDNERRFTEIMESLASLVHVAEIHERRLTDLEDGEQ